MRYLRVSWALPRLRRIFCAAAFVLGFLLPIQTSGQAISELVTSNQPIPEAYESWSLFLVCNPQWVVPEGEEALETLYTRFQAFGRALGPDHVAVWFWSRPWTWSDQEELHTAVDVVRSSAFCAQLDLPLSESPYVVVTTEYPGAGTVSAYPESFAQLENFYVVALNGLEMSEVTELLTRLADRIVAEEIGQLEPASEDYWRRWQEIFEGVQTGLVDFSKRIRISIQTQFFTMEWASEP